MTTKAKVVLLGAAIALLLGGAANANAGTISLGRCISGPDCAAYRRSPVTLSLLPVAGGVAMTVENGTNGDLTGLFLLFDGTVSNKSQKLTGGASPGFANYALGGGLSGVTFAIDTYSKAKNNAGFAYNVKVDLPPPGDRLGPTESVTFWIAGMDELGFQGALAHIQSLGNCTGLGNCDGSVKLAVTAEDEKLTVPDGGMTVMLLGCALIGLGVLRRKLGA